MYAAGPNVLWEYQSEVLTVRIHVYRGALGVDLAHAVHVVLVSGFVIRRSMG